MDRPGGDAVPLHRRSIEFEAFDQGGTVAVRGRLRDSRPWAAGTGLVEELHDMELWIAVELASMTIVEAEAVMERFPHVECPAIAPAFAGLVGLSVSRGYVRAVQERFSGPSGCTHLEQLARAMGPVVIQAATSLRARERDWTMLDVSPAARPSLFPRNTCHIWAEDGVAEQKLAAGWRPGAESYPAPSLVEIRARAQEPPA